MPSPTPRSPLPPVLLALVLTTSCDGPTTEVEAAPSEPIDIEVVVAQAVYGLDDERERAIEHVLELGTEALPALRSLLANAHDSQREAIDIATLSPSEERHLRVRAYGRAIAHIENLIRQIES